MTTDSRTGLKLLPEYQGVEVVPRARDYLIDRERYRRVSTILGVINKPALVPWAKRTTLERIEEILRNPEVEGGLAQLFADGPDSREYETWVDRVIAAGKKAADSSAAADRGTRIHEEIRQALSPPYVERVISDECGHALNFLEDKKISVDAVEMTLWDTLYKIAGTCDAIGRDSEGRRIIWDWKTGSGPWPEMALQLGAYAGMLQLMTGESVHGAYVVKVKPDGYEPHYLDWSELTDAIDGFNDARALKNTMDKGWWR